MLLCFSAAFLSILLYQHWKWTLEDSNEIQKDFKPNGTCWVLFTFGQFNLNDCLMNIKIPQGLLFTGSKSHFI